MDNGKVGCIGTLLLLLILGLIFQAGQRYGLPLGIVACGIGGYLFYVNRDHSWGSNPKRLGLGLVAFGVVFAVLGFNGIQERKAQALAAEEHAAQRATRAAAERRELLETCRSFNVRAEVDRCVSRYGMGPEMGACVGRVNSRAQSCREARSSAGTITAATPTRSQISTEAVDARNSTAGSITNETTGVVDVSPNVVASAGNRSSADTHSSVNAAINPDESRVLDTLERDLSLSIEQGLRGAETGEKYSILRPRTGTPLQIEVIQIIDAGNRTDFLVRLRNVGNSPLTGYFKLSCSTALGQSEGTIVASALAPGRRQHYILAVDGNPTTQGSCSVAQKNY